MNTHYFSRLCHHVRLYQHPIQQRLRRLRQLAHPRQLFSQVRTLPISRQSTRSTHIASGQPVTIAAIALCTACAATLFFPPPVGARPSQTYITKGERSGAYQYPVGNSPTIITSYSPGENNWNAGHRGVDLAADIGQPVYAAAKGKVIYAGILNDRGVISIEDRRGIRTTYEPVSPSVTKGQNVTKGETIGTIDGYHCGAGIACLHWGAKRGSDSYMNPLWLVDPPIVRLLE